MDKHAYVIEDDLGDILQKVADEFGEYYKKATGREEELSRHTTRQIAVVCALHQTDLVGEAVYVAFCNKRGDGPEENRARNTQNECRDVIVSIIDVLVHKEKMKVIDRMK